MSQSSTTTMMNYAERLAGLAAELLTERAKRSRAKDAPVIAASEQVTIAAAALAKAVAGLSAATVAAEESGQPGSDDD